MFYNLAPVPYQNRGFSGQNSSTDGQVLNRKGKDMGTYKGHMMSLICLPVPDIFRKIFLKKEKLCMYC